MKGRVFLGVSEAGCAARGRPTNGWSFWRVKNARGEWVEAVELQTADTLYLVKIGTNLSYLLSHFEDLEAEGEPEERQISAVGELEGEYDGSLESELDLDD